MVAHGGGAVSLGGGGLGAAQRAGGGLVLHRSLGEGSGRGGLPSHLPELFPCRRLLLVEQGAGVVPDLVAVADAQARRTRRRDNVLPVRAPEEVGGVRHLGLRHLIGTEAVSRLYIDTSFHGLLHSYFPVKYTGLTFQALLVIFDNSHMQLSLEKFPSCARSHMA